MFLTILVTSTVAEDFFTVAIMSKRGECIVTCSPFGSVLVVARNVLKPQVF